MISARLRGYISAELAEKRKKSILLAWDRIGPLPYDEILQGSSFFADGGRKFNARRTPLGYSVCSKVRNVSQIYYCIKM